MASRLVNVAGASSWFRGAVVSYATEVSTTCSASRTARR